jgi:hypothetical protein
MVNRRVDESFNFHERKVVGMEFKSWSTQESQEQYYISFLTSEIECDSSVLHLICSFACEGFNRPGFKLAAFDQNIKCWSLAEVVNSSPKSVSITYIGWNPAFVETIQIPEEENRLAPFDTVCSKLFPPQPNICFSDLPLSDLNTGYFEKLGFEVPQLEKMFEYCTTELERASLVNAFVLLHEFNGCGVPVHLQGYILAHKKKERRS